MPDEQRQGSARLDFLLFELRNDQLGICHRGALRGEFRRTNAAGVVASFREVQDALSGLDVQAGERDSLAQRQDLKVAGCDGIRNRDPHGRETRTAGAGQRFCRIAGRAILAPKVNFVTGRQQRGPVGFIRRGAVSPPGEPRRAAVGVDLRQQRGAGLPGSRIRLLHPRDSRDDIETVVLSECNQ